MGRFSFEPVSTPTAQRLPHKAKSQLKNLAAHTPVVLAQHLLGLGVCGYLVGQVVVVVLAQQRLSHLAGAEAPVCFVVCVYVWTCMHEVMLLSTQTGVETKNRQTHSDKKTV